MVGFSEPQAYLTLHSPPQVGPPLAVPDKRVLIWVCLLPLKLAICHKNVTYPKKRGKLFHLQLDFELTVKLLCLQSLEALIRRTFPL